jgi:glycosyltransferase involved in cell wall biosynthesis
VRVAIYENLPPGGAKRASFELGRFVAGRHEVDLYALNVTSTAAFDLAPVVRRVFRYRFAPWFGVLDARLAHGRLAPRALTIFGPLRRLHRRIARDIRDRGYDVVLAHTDAFSQSPYLLRWLGPPPTVYFCQEVLRIAHESRLQAQQRRRLLEGRPVVGAAAVVEDWFVTRAWRRADRTTTRAASRVVVNSTYMQGRVVSAYGVDATVCYLGVDPDRFSPRPNADRRNEILSIGAPLNLKGHDLVIEALARVPSAVRPSLTIIAPSGRGDDASALEALARECGVTATIEIDLDEEGLVERYQRAMATVCAARLEPFGLTAIESMACATPVIAIREGGFRESVIDQRTGLLVEPTAHALAVAIEALAADPSLARRLGEAGREQAVACWTWERSGCHLEQILLDLARP